MDVFFIYNYLFHKVCLISLYCLYLLKFYLICWNLVYWIIKSILLPLCFLIVQLVNLAKIKPNSFLLKEIEPPIILRSFIVMFKVLVLLFLMPNTNVFWQSLMTTANIHGSISCSTNQKFFICSNYS